MFGPASGCLDDLDRAIDKLIASECALELPRLRKAFDRLEAHWLQSVRVAERDGAFAHPHTSPAGVLAQMCALPFGAAKRDVKTARVLDSLPLTDKAFAAGEITPQHVRVITGACTPARTEALRDYEPELVRLAIQYPPRDLQSFVTRICDAIDGDGGAASASDLHDQRRLHVSKSLDGVAFVDGTLDPESAEIVITGLEHAMANDPDTPGDTKRTRPQHRADALVHVFRHYNSTCDLPAPKRRRGQPHAGITASLELLRRDGLATTVDDLIGDLEHTGAVSAETLRRLTCDATIHRILLRGKSEILDVGHATRTVPTALWRALVARDRHCTHPGCTQRPGWCEAHHIQHWADGGPTNLDNLQLLCWRHHRQHHEGKAPRGP